MSGIAYANVVRRHYATRALGEADMVGADYNQQWNYIEDDEALGVKMSDNTWRYHSRSQLKIPGTVNTAAIQTNEDGFFSIGGAIATHWAFVTNNGDVIEFAGHQFKPAIVRNASQIEILENAYVDSANLRRTYGGQESSRVIFNNGYFSVDFSDNTAITGAVITPVPYIRADAGNGIYINGIAGNVISLNHTKLDIDTSIYGDNYEILLVDAGTDALIINPDQADVNTTIYEDNGVGFQVDGGTGHLGFGKAADATDPYSFDMPTNDLNIVDWNETDTSYNGGYTGTLTIRTAGGTVMGLQAHVLTP